MQDRFSRVSGGGGILPVTGLVIRNVTVGLLGKDQVALDGETRVRIPTEMCASGAPETFIEGDIAA